MEMEIKEIENGKLAVEEQVKDASIVNERMNEKENKQKKIKITNEDLVKIYGFPDIIIRNTYFWGGRYGNLKGYRNIHLEDFKNALENLVKVAGEGEVMQDGDNIYLVEQGKKHFVFHFSQSRKNTYKYQNLQIVKDYIRKHYNIISAKMIAEEI